MLAEERFALILNLLAEKRTATVQELCEALNASESTIRRDLTELARQGRLNKVHGGATLPDGQFLADEPTMAAKEALAVGQKRSIAQAAADLIRAEDFIYIDAGTTTLAMVRALSGPALEAHYVTNGIAHARLLAQKSCHVCVPGGLLRPRTEAIIGAAAITALQQFNFTKAFIGANGVALNVGFTTPDPEEAAVVRTLGTELVRDYGTDKPVVLVGRYTLGENITRYTTADPMQHPLYRFFREHTSWESGDTVKYVETNCNSVLNWSVTAFSEVDDVYGQAAEHLFRYYGFALDMTHSAALHEQAQTYADAHDLPGYPRAGAIVDCGDYVLVNLQ